MVTSISSKGQIVLPVEIRREDGIKAGQVFEIERLGPGEYRLARKVTGRSRKGLAKLLLSCPVKGWLEPVISEETTDSICLS